MFTEYAIVFCFFFLVCAIYIAIIRWVFRIDYIVSLLAINSKNTSGQFEMLKIIKKQNDRLIGQTTVLIEQQEKMIEILEQSIELFESNTEDRN